VGKGEGGILAFLVVQILALKEGKMGDETNDLHVEIMDEIQKEWCKNMEYHMKQNRNVYGIRSSQISALVAILIKRGIILKEAP